MVCAGAGPVRSSTLVLFWGGGGGEGSCICRCWWLVICLLPPCVGVGACFGYRRQFRYIDTGLHTVSHATRGRQYFRVSHASFCCTRSELLILPYHGLTLAVASFTSLPHPPLSRCFAADACRCLPQVTCACTVPRPATPSSAERPGSASASAILGRWR